MIDSVVRAYRGVVRSPMRSALIIVLLAAGLSFALTSLALAFAADDELEKIKLTTGVEGAVSINPQQFTDAIQQEVLRVAASGEAFDAGNVGAAIVPLREDHARQVEELPYVRRMETFTVTAVTFELTDGRDRTRENILQTPLGSVSLPDAVITGAGDGAFLTDFQTGEKRLEEGRMFTPEDEGSNVVVIDLQTASIEELEVGDTVLMSVTLPAPEGEEEAEPVVKEVEAEIIGIYADLAVSAQPGVSPAQLEAWYAPVSLVRELQEDGSDSLSAISIVYDSVDSAELLEADLAEILDPQLYTVTTTRERFENISGPVETMRNTSLLVMVGGLGVVSLIMVLLMALVIRGRLREIGILKAIGARNRQVISQFALETVGVAAVAVIVAVPAVLAINAFLPDLLRPSAEVEARGTGGDGLDLGAGARALTAPPVIDDPVRTEEVEAVLRDINASVGPEVIGIAAAIAIGLGLIGALVPIVAVLRLRPAEVLRLEG